MQPGTTSVCFLNGVYIGEESAVLPWKDRAFLFGDGIYEVIAVVGSELVDFDRHIDRLFSSAEKLDLAIPYTRVEWLDIHRKLITQNGLDEGIVYIQVSRGSAAHRDFVFDPDLKPFTIAFVQKKALTTGAKLEMGISCLLEEDIRWKRRDIKSTALLGQVIPKQKAHAAGVGEALLHENGIITEGASTSFFAIDHNGRLRTHPLTNAILPGVTRKVVLELAAAASLEVIEEAVKLAEIAKLQEAFATGATFFVVPIVSIDQHPIGTGLVGAITRDLQNRYIARSKEPNQHRVKGIVSDPRHLPMLFSA